MECPFKDKECVEDKCLAWDVEIFWYEPTNGFEEVGYCPLCEKNPKAEETE